MVSAQGCTEKRFEIVRSSMSTTDPPPEKPKPKPRNASKKWSRAEKLQIIGPFISILGAMAAWGTFGVHRANREDAQAQTEEAKRNKQIDSRVSSALDPIKADLAVKVTNESLRQSSGGMRKELKDGLDGIRSEIVKSNESVHQVQVDGAALNARINQINEDVRLLLQRQLRAAADFPPQVLAAQISNVYALYQMAAQRSVTIPSETNNLLRMKLAAVETSDSDFWPLAAIVISRVSRALIGGNLQTKGTITSTYTDNIFSGQRVILDNIRFANNVCDRCIIEYHGGPTDVRSCAFTNSLFIIAIHGPVQFPSPEGQKVIRTLLASSNLRSVKFDAN